MRLTGLLLLVLFPFSDSLLYRSALLLKKSQVGAGEAPLFLVVLYSPPFKED